MKRLIGMSLITLLLCASSMAAFALDPLAPLAQRSEGMIYVFTPQPTDTVTITKANGFSKELQPGKIYWVPIGDYTVAAKMQEYNYQQHVTVQPTERADIIVPGFGNLQINSISPKDDVEVYSVKNGNLAAKFQANHVKTLPQGHYDVKIKVGNTSVTKNNVWIITNTTRQVDVSYADNIKNSL